MGDRRTGRNCGGRFRARNPCRRLDVFVLGEVQGLDERLAEIGEGGGGFGLHLTLGDSGEEASEGGAEIAGGHIAAGKVIGDILAGGLASKGLGRRGCGGEKQIPRYARDDTRRSRPSRWRV